MKYFLRWFIAPCATIALPIGISAQHPAQANAAFTKNGNRCTIIGTNGNDVLVGTRSNDVICGLGGNDTIYGRGGNDDLDGGAGNDRLLGGPGQDVLSGGKGRDWLDGGADSDKMVGGSGVDTVSYSSRLITKSGESQQGVDVSLDGVANDGYPGENDQIIATENLIGTDGDDKLSGNSDENRINGGSGDDNLDGGTGDDNLKGGAGSDVLDGGENNDTIIGDGGDDVLSGGPEDDNLDGGEGSDTLDGGTGLNTCVYSAEDIVERTCDTFPPSFESVKWETPKTVDTSDGPATVTLTLHVKDDLSGVTSVNCMLVSTSTDSVRFFAGDQHWQELLSGDALDGIYRLDIVVDQYAPPSEYRLECQAQDVLGRTQTKTAGYLDQTGLGDTTPAEIVSIHWTTSTTVDTSDQSVSLLAIAHVTDDMSGLYHFVCEVSSPDSDYRVAVNPRLISGTSRDGEYVMDVVLARYAPPGTYEMGGCIVIDKAKSYSWYSSADLFSMGLSAITQTGPGDTKPPKVESISWVDRPAKVDVSAAAANVKFQGRLTDNLSGVDGNSLSCYFIGVTNRSIRLNGNTRSLVSGSATDGIHEATIYIPVGTPSDTYKLGGCEITDAVNNTTRLTFKQAAALSWDASITVK